jgi:hypothetical protein
VLKEFPAFHPPWLGFVPEPIYNLRCDESGTSSRWQKRHAVTLARGSLTRRQGATGEVGEHAPGSSPSPSGELLGRRQHVLIDQPTCYRFVKRLFSASSRGRPRSISSTRSSSIRFSPSGSGSPEARPFCSESVPLPSKAVYVPIGTNQPGGARHDELLGHA